MKNPRKFRRVLRALDSALRTLSPERRRVLPCTAVVHPEHRATLRRALDRGWATVRGVRPWVTALLLPLDVITPDLGRRTATNARRLARVASIDHHPLSHSAKRILRALPPKWRGALRSEVRAAVDAAGAGRTRLALRGAPTRGDAVWALVQLSSPEFARGLARLGKVPDYIASGNLTPEEARSL